MMGVANSGFFGTIAGLDAATVDSWLWSRLSARPVALSLVEPEFYQASAHHGRCC